MTCPLADRRRIVERRRSSECGARVLGDSIIRGQIGRGYGDGERERFRRRIVGGEECREEIRERRSLLNRGWVVRSVSLSTIGTPS